MTPADLRAWRLAKTELTERQQWAPLPDRAHAIQLLGGVIDQHATEPLVFKRDRKGWNVGGTHPVVPSDAIGAALSTLHAAVASPWDPQVIALDPDVSYADALSAARKRITQGRQHISEHCPVLGAVLKHVRVTQDEQRRPIATYCPPPGTCSVIIW